MKSQSVAATSSTLATLVALLAIQVACPPVFAGFASTGATTASPAAGQTADVGGIGLSKFNSDRPESQSVGQNCESGCNKESTSKDRNAVQQPGDVANSALLNAATHSPKKSGEIK